LVDNGGMTRNTQVLSALGILLFADGLLLVTNSFTTLAKIAQLPLYAGLCYAIYLDNPESFHRPVSHRVVFWSIFGILASLAAFVAIWSIFR
jgi:hypothetical protein